MVAVRTFQAYALSRPQGWPSGLYDGTISEDELRLFRNGREVLSVPRGTTGVLVSGAELTLPVADGELVVELRPPAPADPKATALAFALHLAGGREQQKRVLDRTHGVSCGLALVAFLPLLASLIGSLFGGFWVPGVGTLTTALCLVVFRTRWDESKRRHAAIGLCVFGVLAVVVATVVGMMFRAANAAPVYR